MQRHTYCIASELITVKPPIKDTLKEDKPPNKGQTKREQQEKMLGPKCVHYLKVPL